MDYEEEEDEVYPLNPPRYEIRELKGNRSMDRYPGEEFNHWAECSDEMMDDDVFDRLGYFDMPDYNPYDLKIVKRYLEWYKKELKGNFFLVKLTESLA